MPLNKQVFQTRAISAVVFVVIMLAGLLWNQWSFLLLFTIIHFGCWHEYLNLMEKIYRVTFHRYLRWGLMLIGFGLMLSFCGKAYTINGFWHSPKFVFAAITGWFSFIGNWHFSKKHFQPESLWGCGFGLVVYFIMLGNDVGVAAGGNDI